MKWNKLDEMESQHNRHFLVFVRKLMFLKYSCQKILEKNCGRPVFSEELAGCKKFFKGFPAF